MKISCLFFVSTNFNTRFIKLSCLTLCKKNSIQININENFNINKFKLIFSNFSFFQFSKIKYFLNEIRILFRENSIFFFFFFYKMSFFLYFASITIWIKVNISSLILRIRLNSFRYDRSK